MTRQTPAADEQIFEDDVNYGIADCRKRMRSQRSSLREQNPPTNRLDPSPDRAVEQFEEREEALIT